MKNGIGIKDRFVELLYVLLWFVPVFTEELFPLEKLPDFEPELADFDEEKPPDLKLPPALWEDEPLAYTELYPEKLENVPPNRKAINIKVVTINFFALIFFTPLYNIK